MHKSLTQQCWEWIAQQPDFHSTELAKVMDVSMPQIKSVMDELIRRGYISAIKTSAKPYLYSANDVKTNFTKTRPNPHDESNSRQRIWQAMRFIGGRFTVEQIQAASLANRSNIMRYLSELVKYEYVVKVRGQWVTGKQKHAKACEYLLIKNTGWKYPVIRKSGLWDQNQHTLVKSRMAPCGD